MSETLDISETVQTITCLLCNGIITYMDGNPKKFFKHLQHNHDVHANHHFLLKLHLVKKEVIDGILSENHDDSNVIFDNSHNEHSVNEEGYYAPEMCEDILLYEGSDYKNAFDSENCDKLMERELYVSGNSVGNLESSSLSKDPDEDQKYVCRSKKSGIYSTRWLKQEKINDILPPMSRVYVCSDCGKSFNRRLNLREHKMTHTREKFNISIEKQDNEALLSPTDEPDPDNISPKTNLI